MRLYVPAIGLAGGKWCACAWPHPTTAPDWDAVAAAIRPRTPHDHDQHPQPTATVWTQDDLDRLAALVRGTGIVVVADEVTSTSSSTARRTPPAPRTELAQRSFVVSSFGKTYQYHRLEGGLRARPRELMAEFRKGASVQRVHRDRPGTARARRHMGRRLRHPRPGRVLPGQARSSARAGRLALRAAALARHRQLARCGRSPTWTTPPSAST